MPENANNNSQSDYKRVGVSEFFKITWWALGFLLQIHPFKTIIWLLTSVVDKVQPLLYTYIFARAIDSLIKVAQVEGNTVREMYPYLAQLLGYSVISLLITLIKSQVGQEIRATSQIKIKRSFYTKLHSLGISTLEQPDVNDKISRASDYLANLMPFLAGTVQIIATLINTITLTFLIFSFTPIVALVIIAVSIPYIIFDKRMKVKFYTTQYETTEERRKANLCSSNLINIGYLQEIITTKALGFLDEKYTSFMNWFTQTYLKLFAKERVGNYSFDFITSLTVYTGYVVAFSRLIAKQLTVGSVLFWIRSLDMFQQSLQELGEKFNSQFEASIQLKDTYILYNTKSRFPDGDKHLPVLDKGPKIELINVNFKYPRNENLVIQNINLVINPGEKIAIVGQNGAGKTTITKLISRFYPVTSGEIRINDLNINSINGASLYENMGTLFQNFNAYHQLTVKENICIGRSDKPFDDMKMRTAAQTADAMEFINNFPNKFDQVLDPKYKGGIEPSTGQWQKLAIARFFYRNAPLVIFDEPTASIDAVSEYNIFNKIYDFFEGKTVIIISHRFSTVRNADRIIVLDQGQIVEEGTHKQLMEMKGKYYEAFQLQAKGYTD